MTEEELRDLLREMRDDPVPVDSLVRFRAGLAHRTRKRTWPRWAIAAFAISAVCLALLFRPAVILLPPNPPAMARLPEIPAVAPPLPPAPVHQVRQQVRRRKPPQQPQNVVIRIETADPDVLILLLGD